MISVDTPNAISSPVSAAGASRFDSPAGPTIALSGPDHAPASLSARQAKERGLLTSGTYGPHGTGSSSSAALASSLASRLRQRLSTIGSTLFKLTWKDWATPQGRSVSLLRASGLRTPEAACGSWPTPLVNDELGSTHCYGPKKTDGTERKRFLKLPGAVLLTSWETPMAHEARLGYQNRRNGKRGTQESLTTQVVNGLAPDDDPRLSGQPATGSRAATTNLGQLNPAHSRWLMGYPPEWDACAPMATPSSRKSRQK